MSSYIEASLYPKVKVDPCYEHCEDVSVVGGGKDGFVDPDDVGIEDESIQCSLCDCEITYDQ